MKVVITGASGQLGSALTQTAPASWDITALTSADLDIGDPAALTQLQAKHPAIIINCAAYTAVDQAETDTATAQTINAEAPGHLAELARSLGAKLIHVSTDYVFDGQACQPYAPEADVNPLSSYGRSKAQGESRVLQAAPDALVLRTSWVYTARHNNFVSTMLRLMSERDTLKVVADQIGTPTWAMGLAHAIWRFCQHPELSGIYHWTDAGTASWYDFAVAIDEEARAAGLLDSTTRILPITSEQYPTPAPRPHYSVLDKTATWEALDIEPVHWRQQLRKMLQAMQSR